MKDIQSHAVESRHVPTLSTLAIFKVPSSGLGLVAGWLELYISTWLPPLAFHLPSHLSTTNESALTLYAATTPLWQ